MDIAQANFFPKLSEEQRIYFECSLSRFKFALDRVTKYLPLNPGILDLGCAPGYLSIFLNTVGRDLFAGKDSGRLSTRLETAWLFVLDHAECGQCLKYSGASYRDKRLLATGNLLWQHGLT